MDPYGECLNEPFRKTLKMGISFFTSRESFSTQGAPRFPTPRWFFHYDKHKDYRANTSQTVSKDCFTNARLFCHVVFILSWGCFLPVDGESPQS